MADAANFKTDIEYATTSATANSLKCEDYDILHVRKKLYFLLQRRVSLFFIKRVEAYKLGS